MPDFYIRYVLSIIFCSTSGHIPPPYEGRYLLISLLFYKSIILVVTFLQLCLFTFNALLSSSIFLIIFIYPLLSKISTHIINIKHVIIYLIVRFRIIKQAAISVFSFYFTFYFCSIIYSLSSLYLSNKLPYLLLLVAIDIFPPRII